MRLIGLARAALLLILLLTSCSSAPVAVTPAASTPTTVPIKHATEIRFALIGKVTDVNVWALFDAQGGSYNNYAVRSEYWPRLYHLSVPGRRFEPMAAQGMPSLIQQEGEFYVGTAMLRSDLAWTDGSPFTADDVVFTVNTVLSFELGFDWGAFYNKDYLARAEAVDSHTVKFYFKRPLNIGLWQYGALQGPIVQKKYWEEKVNPASAFLPDGVLRTKIVEAQSQIKALQVSVDELNSQLRTLQTDSKEYQQADGDLKREQGNLDEANNDLTKLLEEYDGEIASARQALYALDDTKEPTLGNWIPAGKENDAWANEINPKRPFGRPSFDRASYHMFPDEQNAFSALQRGKVDVILKSRGLSAGSAADPSDGLVIRQNPSSSMRYLVFNHANQSLADPAIRQALGCMIVSSEFGNISDITSFVPQSESFWHNPEAGLPCMLMDTSARLEYAADLLKAAGYVWLEEPAWDDAAGKVIAGEGLITRNGTRFPALILLTLSDESEFAPPAPARRIQQKARELGIPLGIQFISPEDLHYAVFSSGEYDMAILGWRLSAYPGYLCEWFKEGNPFHYGGGRLRSECEALEKETDLETARQHIYKIQSILAEDLPFIPLYSAVTYDAYRNVSYPFDHVLDGLSGMYGAPSLANPLP